MTRILRRGGVAAAILVAAAVAGAGPTPAPVPVAGRVTDLAGRPLAKVRVEAALPAGTPNPAPPPVLTDEDGLFRMPLPAGATLEFTREGFLKASAAAGDGEVEQIVVALIPAARLTVMVEQDGRALEGAKVSLFSGGLSPREASEAAASRPKPLAERETDARGDAFFEDLEPGLYWFDVTRTGYVGRRAETSFSVRAGTNLATASLRPARRVHGTVLDASGEPIEGTRVEVLACGSDLRGSPRPYLARTAWTRADPRGRYEIRIEDEEPDAGFCTTTVVAVAPGHGPAFRLLPARHEEEDLDFEFHFVLPPEAKVEGRLVDSRGEGVEGVEVRAHMSVSWDEGEWPPASLAYLDPLLLASGKDAPGRHVSADDGRFELTGLPACKLRLQPWEPGTAPAGRDASSGWIEVGEGRDVRGVEIIFDEGRVLRGFVEDMEGVPIAGARIAGGARGLLARPDVETRTDEAGAFRLSGLQETGLAELDVSAEGFGRKVLLGVLPSRKTLRVKLQPAGALAGRVLDADTGEPVSSFVINLVPVRKGEDLLGTDQEASFSEPEGTFLMEGVTPGTYSLQVFSRSHLPGSREEIAVPMGAEVPIPDLLLRKGRTIRGTVVDAADGTPIAGAALRLSHMEEDRDGLARPDALGRPFSATTDGDGAFEIPGIPSREMYLSVKRRGYAYIERPVVFEEDEWSKALEITLGGGGSVRATLLDARGGPVAGEPLMLVLQGETWGSGSGRGISTTDASGVAAFERVQPGRYVVSHLRSVKSASVEVEEGKVSEVTLRPKGTVLEGELRIRGEPVEGGRATLVTTDHQVGYGLLEAAVEGSHYEFEPLPPGRYKLVAGARAPSGARLTTREEIVVIPEGGRDPMRRDVDFPALPFVGTLVRGDTGEPVPEALVSLHPQEEMPPGFFAPSSRTGADGAFEVLVESAGTYRIEVKPPAPLHGWRLQGECTAQVFDGGDREDRILTLLPPLDLRGVVLDPEGRPVAGAFVGFLSAWELRLRGRLPLEAPPPWAGEGGSALRPAGGEVASPFTDHEGAFEIPADAAGPGVLVVADREYSPSWVPVTVREEGNDPVRVRLGRGGSLEVRPPIGWGKGSPAGELVLRRPDLPAPIRLRAGWIRSGGEPYYRRTPTGTVLFPLFPEGTWTVAANWPGGSRRAVVEVREGERATADLDNGS